MPHTLKEFGVDLAQIELMSDMAIVDPTAGGNPVPLTRDIAMSLYRKAYEGTL